MSAPPRRFRVALSFPGEHRPFVEQVAAVLSHPLGRDRVLYDNYYEAEFARVSLDTYLQRLYHDESDLIAVFLCADYEHKRWCGLEWRAIRDLIQTRREADIMFLRFDDTEIPGLYSGDGYVPIGTRTPDQIAQLILQRLGPTLPPASIQPQIAPSRLHHGAERLFGRDDVLHRLDQAWQNTGPDKTNVLAIVAWGGVGKTSLVAHWMARLAGDGWHGAERVFDWSFYSQGTREQGAASADAFVREALRFFGDPAMAESNASAWDKGARLAQLVAQRRTLLVLDGLEPLQHGPGPLAGQLKDPALAALLKGLAQHNPGLCIVTTRETVTDLAVWHSTTAPEWPLEHLSEEAGAALLHSLGVTRAGAAQIGPQDLELKQASGDVKGHALSLRLLGGYLAKAHQGDVRQRDLINVEKADAQFKTNPADAAKPYGHAFKVIATYANWLAAGGVEGQRQLALLRLMGFFDRPADPACLAALCQPPAIAGLTEPLIGLAAEDWNSLVHDLQHAGLVRTSPWEQKKVKGHSKEAAAKRLKGFPLGDPTEESPSPSPSTTANCPLTTTLDCHPLLREYFAAQLRTQHPEASRDGHGRLYEHLCDCVPYWPEGADGLAPLYQAVAHGCQAGRHQEACDEVYRARILRSLGTSYSVQHLGLFGSDLGAVACFFEQRWSRLASALSESAQAWLLHQAAFRLRALGRLIDAREPTRVSIRMNEEKKRWGHAALSLRILSQLEVTLGDLAAAVIDAEKSALFAKRSNSMGEPTTLADAFHQAGREPEALVLFREAEDLQAKKEQYPLLYSLPGFRYCDLLLSGAELAAWRVLLQSLSPYQGEGAGEVATNAAAVLLDQCREVQERATKTLEWAQDAKASLLNVPLDHLTLGRAALYRAILDGTVFRDPQSALAEACREVTTAVNGLRAAGRHDQLPRGLHTRAWLRFLEGDAAGARADLDEAWQIAERGPMPLFMADIQLHRARLFHDREALAEACRLIGRHGYHRRDGELADAQQAASGW